MHVAAWHETYRGIVPDAMLASLSVERRAESWQRILGDPAKANDTMVTLAELGGEFVGFGACGAQRTDDLVADGYDGEIGSIYVLNAYQRRGVGKQLTYAMTQALLRRGYHGVALWVLRGNVRARGFYDWCQGRVVATREDVRGDTILVEDAYAWPDLQSLNRKVRE
ncbi:MAG TPA: GNAT family N-acetyltransferase [Xanthobacteraceae bacterium]|jgi:ribosomal protein S18 acetylase RimI-like enzyme